MKRFSHLNYPRVSSTHPKMLDAIFKRIDYQSDEWPDSIEIVHDSAGNESVFIHISLISLVKKQFDPDYLRRLKQATAQYLLVDGMHSSLVRICSESLEINLRSVVAESPSSFRRAAVDRVNEFERRLNAYESSENHPLATITAIVGKLQERGYPTPEMVLDWGFLPDGRRERTDATMLRNAISDLEDSATRSACSSRFEALATQLWGWKYPSISTGNRRMAILNDFKRLQALITAMPPTERPNSSNVTIRMLWHFKNLGVPFSIEMFKIPQSNGNWKKTCSALDAISAQERKNTRQ